mgnify:CR=1 FL=1
MRYFVTGHEMLLYLSGDREDGHGLVPADATAEYICTLDGSREERAFQRAKYSYYDFLDYKDDCYTTVSGYMN